MAPRTSVGVQIQRRPMIVCSNDQRYPKENFNTRIDKRKSRTIPSFRIKLSRLRSQVEVCRKNKRGENSSGGTQVRDPPSKIYCYPLNLDTVETEAIAAPRNVRVQ